MSNLLINEPPLMVLPSLAEKIGLNEAIILQQIHYWIDPRHNKNKKEGKHWVYNSYKEWKKQFPFWSEVTIKRIVLSLEKKKLILSSIRNSNPLDKTKWYTIDYKMLQSINVKDDQPRRDQSDPIDGISLTSSSDQNDPIYNKETETTTNTTNSSLNPSSNSLENSSLLEKRRRKISKPETRSLENSFDQSSLNPLVNIWNDTIGQGVSLTQKRSQSLDAFFQKTLNGSVAEWKTYCLKICSSKFLMGETDAQFKIMFDWAIKPETWNEICAGKYSLGTREVSMGDSEEVAPEIVDAIEGEERSFFEEDKEITESSIRDLFIRRIQSGLEGFQKKITLQKYGFEKAGFSKLLRDYIETLQTKYAKPT